MTEKETSDIISRRKALKTVGVAGIAGLAGCQGEGDNGGGDLGERVPTLRIAYMSNLGGKSDIIESCIAVIAESLAKLGLQVEPKPLTIGAIVDLMLEDKRGYEFALWGFGNVESALDPHDATVRFRIDQAGNKDGMNPGQYASCPFTIPGVTQASATSVEERMELVHKAHSIMNRDRMSIGLTNSVEFGLGRKDLVNWQGLGDYGFNVWNYHPFVQSEPTNDNNTIISGIAREGLETTNYLVFPSLTGFTPFGKLLHSPLIVYDEFFELRTELAESYSVEDDATTFVFELVDSTFHNGDTVTAEDVKFTFEYAQSLFGQADQIISIPYESIEVIDEKTVEMNLEKPFLPLTQNLATRLGIMHKETWEAAGAPGEAVEPDTIPGSGPFQLNSFSRGRRVSFNPYDDHALYDVSHDLVFQGMDGIQAGYSMLVNGDIHMLSGGRMSPEFWVRGTEEHPEIIQGSILDGFMAYTLQAAWPKSPAMLPEFREAVTMAINRQRVNEIAFHGYATPKFSCHFLGKNHPYRPEIPEDELATTNPEGDVEGAKQVLEDAGWGWDDNGNLRYPIDADLEPLWPEGGVPDASNYDCLDENNDLILP